MLDVIYRFKKLKYIIRIRLQSLIFTMLPETKAKTIDDFHKLYYDSSVQGGTWRSNKFLGISTQKCPFDMAVYQEILFDLKPDVIVETGTAYGGGAYYLASICDLINHGEVITIDIVNVAKSPKHKRITYLYGSSTLDKIAEEVKKRIKDKKTVLVILDSNHAKTHVLKELQIYNQFVTKDSYIIVEDTNVNGHPVSPEHGPGPMEAVMEFLRSNNNFKIDKKREKHYITFNPNGYLRRIG